MTQGTEADAVLALCVPVLSVTLLCSQLTQSADTDGRQDRHTQAQHCFSLSEQACTQGLSTALISLDDLEQT